MSEAEKPTEQQILALNRQYEIDGKMVKPTAKQFAFVKFFLLNGRKGTEAARQAGYSKKTAQQIASENLSKPLIQKMLFELERIMNERYIMNFDSKRAALGKIVDISIETYDKKGRDGSKIKTEMVDAHAAIKAVNEDNKMVGDHKEKETVNPEIHIHLNDLDMAL